MNERIKIAIQKTGRLTEHSITLLQKCGLVISHTKDQLIGYGENMPFDIMFVRDDDIPGLIQENLCEIGLVGANVAIEKKLSYEEDQSSCEFILQTPLDFGHCKLSFAYPDTSSIRSIKDLDGKTIATSYPFTVKNYFSENNIKANVTEFSGAVELAPSLGKADAICDLVSTGNTLRAHNLELVETIMESVATVIKSNAKQSNFKNMWIDKIIERINGVLQVNESKYIMMHAPKNAINDITRLLPGTESPTVIPLDGIQETVAVHVVCKETVFWETLEDLKEVGASSILVVPVEKMLM